MKSMLYRRVFMAALGCLALFLIAGSFPTSSEAGSKKTINLRVAAGHPYAPGCFWIQSFEDFFCREIEKRVHERSSDYEVKFKSFYGGSICKLHEVMEGVQGGLTDIGLIFLAFERAKLEPLNFSFWIPNGPTTADYVLKASNMVFNDYDNFQKIFDRYNQRLLGQKGKPALGVQACYALITKFPIKTLKDIQGKKLGNGSVMLNWLDDLGATGVKITYNEVYTSMDTGVIDGYMMPANVVSSFKIYEVGKFFTETEFAGATLATILTINKKTWAKLPKEVQDIINEVASESSWDNYKRCQVELDKAVKIMDDNKVVRYRLPAEEKGRWVKILHDCKAGPKLVADCKKHGFPDFPADQVAQKYVDALQKVGYAFEIVPNYIMD